MTINDQTDPLPLTDEALARLDATWRAANYLSVGQIYLLDNPLLREPLTLEHVKPRLLGHWGTTPGLNFVYAHLNRLIRQHGPSVLYVTGPGHGGPGLVANTYLEGSYTEHYPDITQDEDGMRKLFRQFSFPGGIPSHVSPETPGSINEGGELGYSLAHAYGAVFDNPDLVACCVVGDGEAETGTLATSWHSNKFLNPSRDGAVLPVLHLNGYKIAGPTVLARLPHEELEALFVGYGYTPIFVEGDEPEAMHQAMAAALDDAYAEIRRVQRDARERGVTERPRWPMIVLRSPKGWTGPESVDGKQTEGTFRSHQVPLAGLAENPEHLAMLEAWMRSYRPEELFDADGRLVPELAALAPEGDRRMGSNPHANGGLLLRDLQMPDWRDYAVDVPAPGAVTAEATRVMGQLLRDVMAMNPDDLPRGRPGRDGLEPALGPLRDHRPDVDGAGPRDRRPPRPGRPRDGGPERAALPGLARRLPAHGPPRSVLVLRGVHPHRRLDVQPARQVARCHARHPVAATHRIAQLPAHVARLAPGPQRVQPPGPRLPRRRRQQEGRGRPGLPPAGRQHAPLGHRPLPPEPTLRQRDRGREAARAPVPRPRRGREAHGRRDRDLGVGEQRPRRRAGRGDGLRRRRPDA